VSSSDWDDEKTPAVPHARPRQPTLQGYPPPPPLRLPTPVGTLAPLGPRPAPELAATRGNRLLRNWAACDPEAQRLIEALALRLRPSV
jgi:hypothetical protein